MRGIIALLARGCTSLFVQQRAACKHTLLWCATLFGQSQKLVALPGIIRGLRAGFKLRR
jgi:hypothetical protein